MSRARGSGSGERARGSYQTDGTITHAPCGAAQQRSTHDDRVLPEGASADLELLRWAAEADPKHYVTRTQ
eukprot:7093312-Prymnesium_polylepis.1